jgi:hypothetical protein
MRATACRLCFLMLLALAAPAAAQAATVTIGAQIGKGTTNVIFGSSATLFNQSLVTPGPPLASPIDGTVVRWRLVGATGGPFALRALRLGSGQVAGVRSGPFQQLSEGTVTSFNGTTMHTFPASLPIAAGQIVGIDGKAGSVAMREVAGATGGFTLPPVADGASVPASSLASLEILINADVQPLPAVNLIGPATGPVAGGTQVRISGSDFVDVKAVGFGGVPAASYSVVSESLITAVSPAAAAGPVSVSVTTIAGKSAASPEGQFTYLAPPPAATCVVPKLKQKSLKADRKALKKAGCTLGKVRRKKGAGKGAKVTKQSPKPGTVLPAGGSVGVTVG